jgi:hypothetical protein
MATAAGLARETQPAAEGCEVNNYKCETAFAIVDQAVAPWQAGDDNESQRNQSDGSIGQ